MTRDATKKREYLRRWHLANPGKKHEYNQRWYYANLEKVRASSRGRRRANPERARAATRKYLYGLTSEAFEAMYTAQQGRCAMCLEALGPDKVNVDHDHETGRVRGLLCHACNLAVGWFESPRHKFVEPYLAKAGL